MYDFSKMKGGASVTARLPSDNMSVNGKPLNEIVPGYRQLHVAGRGLVGQEIETIAIPSRRGVYVTNIQDKERELTITFQLVAKKSEDLRNAYTKLNKALRGELSLVFADESDFTYKGYLSSAPNDAEQSLTLVSSFTILVPDPFKQGKTKSSAGLITLTDADEVLPDKIVLSTNSASEIEIIAGNNRMKLKGHYDSRDKITIEWLDDEVVIKHNNNLALSHLLHLSVPEEFYVKNGDTIKATNATVEHVEWRDERL
ncbi:phage tail protein [Streptococcus pyogenes]|uniref:distal tail protein Dit n=2 Tax=Streptococcus pyogenes TaxID=1314 RepID=UPI00109D5486|nr:distal tail protein Dit [Streptococcus pyogenes]QCK38364.1 phage tail protein [Streptococcus pyogenes]VHM08350.1 phage tail protein [Streptococcus pyogenes]VHM90798.1 phage tail protein [Streptococcus pyogenes]HEP1431128.1 phage tail family protein [Streptococcus pyogenes]HES9157216.1 phage tail family protein [Streptococcus pyogenes]